LLQKNRPYIYPPYKLPVNDSTTELNSQLLEIYNNI